MAVKTFCSICDKPIGTIDFKDLKRLTGKEICKDCGEHLTEMRSGMEREKSEFLSEIESMQKKINKTFKLTEAELSKTIERARGLYATRSSELDNRLKDLL